MNLIINHRNGVVDVKFFNSFRLELKFDSVASTFSVNFYFDPKNRQHAEIACVTHYHECIFQHDGETLITGYILSQVFNRNSKKELAQFGGYSKAGVLEDCEIPPTLYPLQSDGLTLREIATKIIEPFKLKMIVDPAVASEMDKPIPTSTSGVVQKVKSYLTELATQRNIIITHDSFGNLVFTRAKSNLTPLFHVENGVIATSISLSFDGQQIHSHITVLQEADIDGGNAGEYTIENPFCPIVYRPKVIKLTSGDDITIEQAARNALAAELKNVQLKVSIDRWKIDGKIVRPNNVISVLSPENFIYEKAYFFIESIVYTGDPDKEVAELTCVPREAYSDQKPFNIFVDPHRNFPRL